MEEIVRNLLKNIELSDNNLKKLTTDLVTVLFLRLVGASQDKLNFEDKKLIHIYWEKKEIEQILRVLERVHGKDEWKKFLEFQVRYLLESYTAEVVDAE